MNQPTHLNIFEISLFWICLSRQDNGEQLGALCATVREGSVLLAVRGERVGRGGSLQRAGRAQLGGAHGGNHRKTDRKMVINLKKHGD